MKFLKIAIFAFLLFATANLPSWSTPAHATVAYHPQPALLEQDSSGQVSTLADVRRAVVRIETTGSFWYRSIGRPSRQGTGSGFIINSQGLAVTNNHVVAGASNLQIWVDGETSPRSARILAVAECSDLAIIDIDGEGFPYLDWYQEQIAPQLAVHAAGFPFGTPSYTVTSGSISNTQAQGESFWSSIGNVIEHSAPISPGDSGGPLVNDQGKVVAVNYLRSRRTGLSYAISRVEAAPIVATLSQGQDVNSIGISGESVALTDEAVAVWISAVTPNSPAGRLGLQPGDIIWNLDGSFLDPNSLMIDYCNTLKRNPTGQKIQIEIYRTTSNQFLSGQLNGQLLRVINPPTDEELTVPSGGIAASSDAAPSPAPTAPDVAQVPNPTENSPQAGGSYSITPPPTWSISNQNSENTVEGIEVEVELRSGAGSYLFISAVGSENVRFARIEDIHSEVRENLKRDGAVTSCASVAESTLAYGSYEMTYSRWTSCVDSGPSAAPNEVYAMTAKSRSAPYHIVGLLGGFAADDNGYDILLKTLAGLSVANPPPQPQPQQPSTVQPVPSQPLPSQQAASAVVLADVLNVRSGPGLQNTVISQVYRGQGLAVVGQANGCGWLRVVTSTNVQGWVSGNNAYVRLAASCASIP